MPQQKELPGKLDHFLTTEIEKQTLRSIIQNAPNDLRAARSISIFIAVMRLNEEETEEALKKVVDFIAQDPALGRSRAEQIKTALMNDAIGYDYSWLVTPDNPAGFQYPASALSATETNAPPIPSGRAPTPA